jgi:RNA exonuclease NGL2
MPSKPSDEEIEEKRRQRAEKKRIEAEKKEAAEKEAPDVDDSQYYTPRRWSKRKDFEIRATSKTIRVLSWNILAQGLVRRKLFPGSDCLKWKEREVGLCAEMRSHDWDVAAFQEVDKIEVHGPNIEKSGRRYLYSKGYASKQHGLMIAWRVKSDRYKAGPSRLTFLDEPAGSRTIYFDLECVGLASEGRRGLSRVTRNIALFVALTSAEDSKEGIIVATTHLFWHPSHAYERCRQTGILKRALVDWRNENPAWEKWPAILAGDFNDQPHSATYKLMTGEELTEHNWEEIQSSSVVHKSVDEAKQKGQSDDAEEDIEEDEEEDDPEGREHDKDVDEKLIKNCRHAVPNDGLLSLAELIQLHDLSQPRPMSSAGQDVDGRQYIGHKSASGLISAYGSSYGSLMESQEGNFFGSSNRGRERFDDLEWTIDTPNPHLGPCKE